ncbi:hypothetical protein H5T52_02880 [Candidatus Bipolaricaulota bacterium]|nr:hypothetical protein [Candidatus Bipolaricaulota bacterium]
MKGTIASPDQPGERTVLALAPAPTVPYPVWVRQERQVGEAWKAEFKMILTNYQHG